MLELKDQVSEMKQHIGSSLKDLKLSDKQSIGYTFKAMGAGFYGLRKGTDFRKTITEVIMEAGDADRLVTISHCSVELTFPIPLPQQCICVRGHDGVQTGVQSATSRFTGIPTPRMA